MKTLFWGDSDTINYLKKELHQGQVVLAQGDTVLGLLADVSRDGVAALDRIKNRSKKPYLILVGDNKKALGLIDYNESRFFQIEKLMSICWPGPVTIIFKAKNDVSSYMKAENGTIALRVPAHTQLLQLLQHFDGLFSTSANSSGCPVPCVIDDVEDDIMHSVSCIVFNDHDIQALQAIPSTIIDCTENQLVVVRQGAFEVDVLKDIFGT